MWRLLSISGFYELSLPTFDPSNGNSIIMAMQFSFRIPPGHCCGGVLFRGKKLHTWELLEYGCRHSRCDSSPESSWVPDTFGSLQKVRRTAGPPCISWLVYWILVMLCHCIDSPSVCVSNVWDGKVLDFWRSFLWKRILLVCRPSWWDIRW